MKYLICGWCWWYHIQIGWGLYFSCGFFVRGRFHRSEPTYNRSTVFSVNRTLCCFCIMYFIKRGIILSFFHMCWSMYMSLTWWMSKSVYLYSTPDICTNGIKYTYQLSYPQSTCQSICCIIFQRKQSACCPQQRMRNETHEHSRMYIYHLTFRKMTQIDSRKAFRRSDYSLPIWAIN